MISLGLSLKFHRLLKVLPLVLFALAMGVVHHELKDHQFVDISQSWHNVPWELLFLAFFLTLLNYFVLSGYDWLALRFTGHKKIPFPRILLTSFISYGISNNTGHAWASGGSVRYRFYNSMGVPGWDVAKISAFLGLTYIIGVMTLGLAGTLLMPENLRGAVESPHIIHVTMITCIISLLIYWGAVFTWRRPFMFKGMEIKLPTPPMALGQTLVSCIDLVLASLVLWVFLKDVPGMTFEIFLVIYVLAQVFGMVSQVPGGIGVFEGTFLWLAGPLFASDHPAILTGLVLYRIIYYFIPLAVSGLLLVAHDLYESRASFAKAGRLASAIIPSTVPHIFSILLFLTGGVLLISGATPTLPENIHWMRGVIPLPIVEFSHLTGSLVGILLLFLARGVRLRLDAAWYGALCLLALGIGASLLKGLDCQEASILAAMFAAIFISRRYFYRKSSLLKLSLNPSWLLMIAAMLIGTIWLGFFSYKHVEYSSDLWWQFSYKDDASRFLRSLIVIGIAMLVLLMWHFLTVYRPKRIAHTPLQDIQDARPLVLQESNTQGFLALLGDKAFFWAEDRSAFLSYGVTPKYWVVMGDPVGEVKSFETLLWRFREEADRYGAKVVFYQVGEENLPLYLDQGLALLKLGQEARVALPKFSLEGKKRDNLRGGHNKLIKLNYAFRILELEEVTQSIERLKEISDAWMAQKKAREKGFSLGFFERNYIKHTRVAVIVSPEGRIMAFANLWETQNKEELSIDLMRYDPEAPRGIMDFLFADLMLWGKAQGYLWFNLGMAPLSGLERHPLAPLWHKIGTAIFDLGEEFYNFEGLYEYKAKFEPEWHSRYLATPAGLSAPFVLLTVTRLIAGGLKGIATK